ncbi:hypothetical protein BIW11_05540, partial [Tropilaelaps mercedesae]
VQLQNQPQQLDDGYVEEDEDDTWSLSSGSSVRKNHVVRRGPIHKNEGGDNHSTGRNVLNSQSPDSALNDKMRWLTTEDSVAPTEHGTSSQTTSSQMMASAQMPGQQQQQPINTAKNYIRTIPIPPTPQNLAPQTGGPPPGQQIYMNLPIQKSGAVPGQQRNGFVTRQLYYDSGRPVAPGAQMVPIAARDYRMIRRIPGEAYPGDHLRRQGPPLSPHQLQQMQATLQQQAQYATLPANMQYHPLASQLTVQLPGGGVGGHPSPQASPTPSPQPHNGQQSLQRYASQTELSGLGASAGAGRTLVGGTTIGKGPVAVAPPQAPQLPQMMPNPGGQTGVQATTGGLQGQSVQQQLYQNHITQGSL